MNVLLLFVISGQPAAPSEPEISNVNADKVTLTWAPPRDDGGSPITGYFVEKKDKFSPRWTRVNQDAVTDTKFTVPGLVQGEEYQFRIVAQNKAGAGKPSESTGPTIAKSPFSKFLPNPYLKGSGSICLHSVSCRRTSEPKNYQ